MSRETYLYFIGGFDMVTILYRCDCNSIMQYDCEFFDGDKKFEIYKCPSCGCIFKVMI